MTDKTDFLKEDHVAQPGGVEKKAKFPLLILTGCLGVAIATPFFLWVPLGFMGLTPSMVDVFGVVGLRFPAAVTISGLMLAAVGFHKV